MYDSSIEKYVCIFLSTYTTTTVEKEVDMSNKELEFRPLWFHPAGKKMAIAKLDLNKLVLTLTNPAKSAHLRISCAGHSTGWHIKWRLAHPSSSGNVSGFVWFMGCDELRTAFRLSDSNAHCPEWIMEKYGANDSLEGDYIRLGNYLNIPGPGTGHDRDPNISIYLSDGIKKAVHEFLLAEASKLRAEADRRDAHF